MIRIKHTTLLSLLITLTIGAVIVGCDNTLSTFDDQQGFYSIYGALDLDEDVNYIRVKDLSEPLHENAGRELEAEVTLENLDRQESEVLEDSVVEFDGIYTHNFRTTMAIRPDERYRVRVEGPGEESTEAITKAPRRSESRINPVSPDCSTNVDIIFENVENPSDIVVTIGFRLQRSDFQFSYQPRERENSNSVRVEFIPKHLIDNTLPQDRGDVWCHNLSSDSLYVNYTHYSPGFFENISSDTLDIPGGASRFGAVYDRAVRFHLDTVNVCNPICPPLDPVNSD